MLIHRLLLPRLFGHKKRGVLYRILPTEDTLDDFFDSMHPDLEALLHLLIGFGLLAFDVSDEVKNYMFKMH